MARPTITDVRRPPARKGINAEPLIETADQTRREDLKRLRLSERADRDYPEAFDPNRMLDLQRGLMCSAVESKPFQSLASAVYNRSWRLPVTEQLWHRVLDAGPERCSTFTIIRPRWIIPHADLMKLGAAKLMEQFRADLNGNLAGERDGWLFAKLDDEFDRENKLHRLHLHGIACGGMVDEVDRLRDLPRYKRQLLPAITGRRVSRPVWIDRKSLADLPMPITYLLKGHFTSRWTGPVGESGTVVRSGYPQRLPEPYHTQTLMWLDKHRLSDLTLMMNLQVRNGQIIIK